MPDFFCNFSKFLESNLFSSIKDDKIIVTGNYPYIENLIGLCRDCHNKAENDNMFNMFCRIKHLENVCVQIYAMIDLNKKLNKHENKRN